MDSMFDTLARSLRERALKPELVNQIIAALRGDEPARAAAAEALDAMAKRAANDADDALGRISPDVLCLWSAVVVPALNDSGHREFLEGLGLERFLWIVGVGASGTSKDPSAVAAFFTACARWATARTTERLVRVNDPDLFAVAATEEDGEVTRRFTAYLAQFTWISKSISVAAARAVQEMQIAALVPDLTPETVMAAADLCSFDWHHPSAEADETDPGMPLRIALSISAGRFAGRPFTDLVQAREMELFPFVRIGAKVMPVAERVIRFAFEQPVLEYVKRCVDNDQRGAVFERVCELVLNEAIGLAPPAPGNAPSVRVSASDEGEVDFLVEGKPHEPLVLGEAKAYFTAATASAAYNAFSAEVGKAQKQLTKRLEAVAQGSVVSGVGHAGAQRPTIGLGVPMHSYGGAIWRGPLWRHEIGEISSDLAVIPIHQAVLVFASMADLTELADYFRFRAEFFSLPQPVVMDEADLLLLFLSGQGEDILRRAHALRGRNAVQIPPHAPDLQFAIADHPGDRAVWRRMFFDRMNKTDPRALVGAPRL